MAVDLSLPRAEEGLPKCLFSQTNEKYLVKRRPCHFGPYWSVSVCIRHRLGHYLLEGYLEHHQFGRNHDFARLPSIRNSDINHFMVYCQSSAPFTAVTFHASRLESRMGIRLRRSYECFLSSLPHSLPCTALPSANRPQGQLGVSMGW